MASATTSIRVSCPNCAKVLRLNTRPAKGKKITCPACSEAFAPQTDDDETGIQDTPSAMAKASSNKASRKGARADEEDDAPKRKRRSDDDEGDEDEAPRKKKKKAKKQGGSMMIVLILVGGVAVLTLCVALPLGAFLLMRAKPDDKGPANPIKVDNPVGPGKMGPLTFNNSIARANKQLFDAGQAFGKAVGPALNGQPANIAEVRRTHKAMQDALASIKADTLKWEVPPGASAKKLFDSHQRFLKVEEDGIKGFGEIVAVLENPALNAQQKANQVQGIFGRLANFEQAALADLQAAQMVFAGENNIKLMPGR